MIAIATRAGEKVFLARTKLTATRTDMGCIFRVNKKHRHTSLKSLVSNKSLELPERPRLMQISSIFALLGVFPNVSKIFHNNNISCFKVINDSPADSMVDVSHDSSLLAREPSQELFSSPRAFGLKRRAKLAILPSYIHSFLARKSHSIRSSSEVIDSKVNPNWARAFGLGNFSGEHNIEIKSLLGLAVEKYSAFRLLVFQKMALIIPYIKLYLQSAIDSRNRNLFLLGIIGENPLVIISRIRFEGKRFSPLSFKDIGNSGNGSHGKVSAKAEPLSYRFITKMVELDLILGPIFLGYLECIITSIGKLVESFSKNTKLFWRDFKFTFNCLDKFHISIISLENLLSRRRALLPAPHGRGLRAIN